jgi:hypothetical protein
MTIFLIIRSGREGFGGAHASWESLMSVEYLVFVRKGYYWHWLLCVVKRVVRFTAEEME